MIYDQRAQPLMEKFAAAEAAESAAIKALAAMLDGVGLEVLKARTEEMTRLHDAKMAIFQEMQAFRLD